MISQLSSLKLKWLSNTVLVEEKRRKHIVV